MSKLPRNTTSSSNSGSANNSENAVNNNNHNNGNTSSTATATTTTTTTTVVGNAMTAKTAQPPVMLMGNGLVNPAALTSPKMEVSLIKKQAMQYHHHHHHSNNGNGNNNRQQQGCGNQVQAACSSIPRSLPLSIPNGAVAAAAAAAAAGVVEIDGGFSSASSTSSLDSLGYAIPFNFAMVWPGVYRCSFPKEEHFEWFRNLGLKTILTLVPDQYPEENVRFLKENGIQHFQIGMHGNKESLARIPHEKISQAVSLVLDRRNHPILIHCNKGKHRTGCVVGCVRKMQNWATSAVLEEYRHYSVPKNRIMDEQLLQSWDGAHLAEFASQQGGWIDPGASQQSNTKHKTK